MIQNSIAIKRRHQKFIEEISESRIVWALENSDGFATSTSNHFEDNDGRPIGLICFWSNRKLANVCAKEAWSEYNPKELRLEEFMENWCIGMHNDTLMIGTNFDLNMFGYEIEPLELIIEIAEKCNHEKTNFEFVKFDGLEDIESQVREIVNER